MSRGKMTAAEPITLAERAQWACDRWHEASWRSSRDKGDKALAAAVVARRDEYTQLCELLREHLGKAFFYANTWGRLL